MTCRHGLNRLPLQIGQVIFHIKAAVKQAGVTFLEEGGYMPHAVKTLLNLPIMKGSRVGVITYSGGAGIMVSDGLESYGLQLAPFSAETLNQMAKLSPAS